MFTRLVKKVRGKKLGIVYDKPHLMAAFEKEQEVQKPRRKVIARHNVPAVSNMGYIKSTATIRHWKK